MFHLTSKQPNNIHGKTIINHKARTKLNLSMIEYVILDFIYEKIMMENKAFEFSVIRRYTGVQKSEAAEIIKSLNEKRFIYKDKKGRIVVDKIWAEIHGQADEDDFRIFWQKYNGRSWPGSKPDTKRLFFKLIGSGIDKEELFKAKIDYFNFLDHPENKKFRKTMGGPVFLNIRNERWKENWKEQLEELNKLGKKETKKPEKSTLTIDDKEKLFE